MSASPAPPVAASTPKASAPEAPARDADENHYNEDAEIRRREKAETSKPAEPRSESVPTSQPDAATQALLQTVELLTQQVKQMQERERRRSRSRDRYWRGRSDSRERHRRRRRDDSREYRRGRSRSSSRRRSPSFGRIPTPPQVRPREPEGPRPDGIAMDPAGEPVESRNGRPGRSVDMQPLQSTREHRIFQEPRLHGHRISNSPRWKAMDRGIAE